ncbi:exonuclease SbcCD subunit D C-terminal domain-containing protein [Pseudoalteromonas gelatinilytica]
MKVLHTSDWHLGQQFYEHSRFDEHQAFLAWLTDTLVSEKIDLLLVAGDIYHTATPPASAENQLYQFIKTTKQHCPNLHIVIIAGNHDSANRIMAAKPLLAQFDTYVVGRFDSNAPHEVVLPISTKNGDAHVVAMPFLRSSDLSSYNRQQEQPLSYNQAVALAYKDALQAVSELPNAPLIAMGHLHTKGGDISSDSERNLVIGGEDAISANIFTDQPDYVALGHLHKAQTVSKKETIRYSGTPMPMSFSERRYQHQVVLVELSDSGTSVNPLYIPSFCKVMLLPEKDCVPLNELCELIKQLDLTDEDLAPYLRVKLSAHDTDTTFREQIEQALEGKQVKFCGIERVRQQGYQQDDEQTLFEDVSQIEALNPHSLLEQAFANNKDMAGQAVPKELENLLSQVIDELNAEDLL